MSSNWRRYEVLLPLQFNDGREVPLDWLAEAVLEIVNRFGAASYETQKVEGHWRQGGVTYRDDLVKIVVDVPDLPRNRQWMKAFKGRWKKRLEQLELWLGSYRIEIAVPEIHLRDSAQSRTGIRYRSCLPSRSQTAARRRPSGCQSQ